jgi:hypothetical protein
LVFVIADHAFLTGVAIVLVGNFIHGVMSSVCYLSLLSFLSIKAFFPPPPPQTDRPQPGSQRFLGKAKRRGERKRWPGGWDATEWE